MKENISKNKYQWLNMIIIILNIIGIYCLIRFSIPYFKHDILVTNPNSMLSSYKWDLCGFILTLGFIPLLISNILAYKFIDLKNSKFKLIYFIPSLVCLVIVCHYLFIETNWKTEESIPIEEFRCSIDGNDYIYRIYEENNTYSLGMDDNDKLPLSIVDYTTKKSIIDSVSKYYEDNNGKCFNNT